MGLGPAGFLVGVNPAMAWDTRELFLPDTGWLDSYFLSSSCGSPRDPGCPSDPERHLCETPGSCGNSVVVDSKCMLAGTANYALFGKMCRLCHDYTGRWNRWDMRAIIGVWKDLLWPLLVLTDTSKQTVNVGLRQLSVGLPQNVLIAALAIASVPTIIVFQGSCLNWSSRCSRRFGEILMNASLCRRWRPKRPSR